MIDKEEIKYFENLRKDFPILKQKINGKPLIYVDNAATTQKPKIVIDAITNYYTRYNANVHRGGHTLGIETTELFENSREKIAKFIGSNSEEIVFTSGTTDSINIIGQGIKNQLKKGDEIILSYQEHHANIIIWQEITKEIGCKIKYLELNEEYQIDIKSLEKTLNNNTKIISISHISNVLGSINDIEKIFKTVKQKNENIITILDAAQSIAHKKFNIKKQNYIDFLVFSGHKMYAPTGVGVLYGKYKLLNKLTPNKFGGGGMVTDVSKTDFDINSAPQKFETGTPNISGVIALGKAVEYLENIGIKRIEKYEHYLAEYFIKKISEQNFEEFQIIGSKNPKNRIPVFSFDCEHIHPHDLTTILDLDGIAIRGGQHCAIPLIKLLNTCATSRISLTFYNTTNEIDKIIKSLKTAKQKFELGEFL